MLSAEPDPSLQQLAISYLAWCPVYGADAAEVVLESLPVSGEG
jgi:hypothetical protein